VTISRSAERGLGDEEEASGVLVDYRRETARIEEARLQSIDTQAAGVGTATVALVVAVSAIVGSDHLAQVPFFVGGAGALLTLIAAVMARAKHPTGLTFMSKLQQGEEASTKRLDDAEQGVVAWWSDASAAPPHSLVFEAWDAYRDLLKSRADDKESWLITSIFGLYFTVLLTPLLYAIQPALESILDSLL
jgi:hypothetical protein